MRMRFGCHPNWVWVAALLPALLFAVTAEADIVFQDDLEGQPAGTTAQAPIFGQDLDPVNPPPVGIAWDIKYEGYPTDYPDLIQVINGDDRLGEDSDNCLYCSRPTGVGTIHAATLFDEITEGAVRVQLNVLNVSGADHCYIAAHSADFSTCLFTLRLDQDGDIKWYDPSAPGYSDPVATYTVGEWQDLNILADLANEQMTVTVGEGPTSEPFGFWDVTTCGSIGFQGANGTEYFIDDITVSTEEVALIPGDANRDGKVTDADAAILATNWQQSDATWGQGDFNADGMVTDADAAILATHWQQGVAEGAAAVPEPGSLVLLGSALLWLLLWRRRRAV